MILQNSLSSKNDTFDNNSSFAIKLSLLIVFISISTTYYFELLASPSAGGWGQLFVILRSSILCPIIGSLTALTILALLKRLSKKTVLYSILINALTIFNLILVMIFGKGISTISEYSFRIFGEPTVEIVKLNLNPSATCNYKLLIKNNSPLPIINARLWEGSLIFIQFTNEKNYPVLECYFVGNTYLNIYFGEKVIEGTTSTFKPGLSANTIIGLDSVRSREDYNITAYIGIDMYGQYHQLKFNYTEQMQSELMKMIKSLR